MAILLNLQAPKMIATRKNSKSGRNHKILGSELVNILNPHVAGKRKPTFFKTLGSISVGNMIPDSIMDGKNSIWENIVSLDILFIYKPSTTPIEMQVIKKMLR